MVVDDIRAACDAFSDLYRVLGSHRWLRVGRGLSRFGPRRLPGTLEAARDLSDRVDRHNVMIKIPATVECLSSIRGAICAGISVNTTLIFGIDRYAAVAGGVHLRARRSSRRWSG